jgi:hypothetical protein
MAERPSGSHTAGGPLPVEEDVDWRRTTELAMLDMSRHARAIIDTVNLLRERLGMETDMQVRLVKRNTRRKIP